MLIDASTNSASTMSKVELVDTHAHLNFNAFRSDADEVIRRSLDNEVWMINVGSNYKTSQKAVEIANKYKLGVFASIGLHPINLDTGLVKIRVDSEEGSHFEKEFDFEKYRELAQYKNVVAIGEIGLDYYWKPKTTNKKEIFKQKQKDLFLKQLELAEELNLPIIFHCRMAHQDLIEVLKSKFQNPNFKIRGVVHCFTGSWQQAEEYLKMGFYLGFNGIIFKLDFKEIIKKTPLDKILIETDCPYLLPPPASLREQPACNRYSISGRARSRSDAGGTITLQKTSDGRNEPLFVKYVAQEIAQIKNIGYEEIIEVTTKNARKLFKI